MTHESDPLSPAESADVTSGGSRSEPSLSVARATRPESDAVPLVQAASELDAAREVVRQRRLARAAQELREPQEQFTTTETITPELASIFLQTMRSNRPLSSATVAAFARDITAGAWKITHQSIALDTSDRLMDGQHRLEGIVKAGVAAKLRVTWSVPEDAFEAIDTGRARSTTDVFAMKHGRSNSTLVVASLKLIDTLSRGFYARGRNSFAEVELLYETFGREVSWAASVLSAATHTVRTAPVVGAVAYAYPCDPEAVERFATTLASREGMSPPMAALWNAAERLGKAGGYARRLDTANITLRCLMAHVQDEHLAKTFMRGSTATDQAKGFVFWRRRREKCGLPTQVPGVDVNRK